jgi:hypothetical protein
LSFTLKDSLNSVLATKTISLSSIGQTPGGTKVHADLSSSVELSSAKTYSIRLSAYPSGMGVYYADVLTTFLTHNEVVASQYVLGRARLNGVDQEFTFKYALHGYKIEGDLSEGGNEPNEEEGPNELIISGARVSNIAGNSATLSWSTNMAADSGATAREQLNPLYIVSSAYDDTMELEHAIVLSGLKKNFPYFADIYSTNSDGDTVSTFTLAFKTLDEEEDENAPPGDEAPLVDEEEPPVDEGDNPPSGDGEPTAPDSGAGDDEGGIPIDSDGDGEPDFDPSSGTPVENPAQPKFIKGNSTDGSFTISWDGLGRDGAGYRVDVFDSHNNLVKQFFLGPDEKLQKITGLGNGAYRVIVYSENDGVYTKIASSDFVVSQDSGRALRWSFVGVGSALGIGLLIWFLKRKRG